MGSCATREATSPSEGMQSPSATGALSVHYLSTTFLEEVSDAGVGGGTVRDVIEPVIKAKGRDVWCKQHQMVGSSYVDAVEGPDNVGPATHMISYTWNYKVEVIVETLRAHCASAGCDPKRTYTWLCCVCVNQWYVAASTSSGGDCVSFRDLSHIFENQIISIGRVLALVAPWRSPENLKRIWCIFEIHKAIALKERGVQLEIVMPPSEKADLMREICEPESRDLTKIWEALLHVDVAKAEAWSNVDKERILAQCESFGLNRLNAQVRAHLRDWCCKESMYSLQTLEPSIESVVAHQRVGYMLSLFHRLDDAVTVLTAGIAISDAVALTPEQRSPGSIRMAKETAGMWHELGWARHRLGDYALAQDACQSGLALVDEQLRTSLSSDDVRSLSMEKACLLRAFARAIVGDDPFIQPPPDRMDEALEKYEHARDIFREFDAGSIELGKIHNNLGLSYVITGDFDSARRELDAAERIYEAKGILRHPPNMVRLYNLGCMHMKRGDVEAAAFKLSEAHEIAQTFNNAMQTVIEDAQKRLPLLP
mmetsp:Transcript_55256/g.153930  ORF Transcript_55256/g.153930 Transcript_55256/m.153930 type:complete len:539 (+) Transcript_55256:44-1660(+)